MWAGKGGVRKEFGLGHMESKEPMGHLSEGVQPTAGEIGLELRRMGQKYQLHVGKIYCVLPSD